MGRASAAVRDGHGVLYPFAAECAAMQVQGVRRAAILQVDGRRVLAVEVNHTEAPGAVERAMNWAHLDEVRVLSLIPMDKRHNAKIDYGSLAEMLTRPK